MPPAYRPAMRDLAGAGHVVGGRYRLRGQIGRGAMGAVWQARDELLHRDVAVKELVISPALGTADRGSLYQRTLREARTAARLSHPGVVTVFDVVEEGGRPWIIMEMVRARSLERVLAEDGPLPPARAAGIGQQLISALAAAHAAGVLHRDVKPSNVLLCPDGRAVLTDFGIATLEGDARLTQAGMVMGTPAFTAPERIRGGAASPASDFWSLGATLYAAVQGRGPYTARGGPMTTMNAVINEDAPAAPAAGPLAPVITALMHRDPAARPDAATADRMLAAAGPVTPEPPAAPRAEHGPAPAPGARHAAEPVQAGTRAGRRRRRTVLAACAAVAIVAAGVPAGFAIAHVSSPAGKNGRAGQTTRHGAPGAGHPRQAAAGTHLGQAPQPLPAGYSWYTLPAASAGTAAGFRTAVPAGWGTARNGLATYVRNPSGGGFLDVDLTQHTKASNLAQARWLEMESIRQDRFPGYRQIALRPATILGSPAALWTFSWMERGVGRVIAQDYLFSVTAAGGTQCYAVYGSAPAADWPQTSRALGEAISTFQPLT